MENKTFLSRIGWDTSQLLRKSLTSLKALTLLLVLCLSIGNAWGADVTYVFAEATNNPGNGEEWTSDYMGLGTSWSADKGSGSNEPKYYNTGSGLRLYSGGVFTIESGTKMASITLTFSSTSYTFSTSATATSQTVTPNAKSFSWEVTRSSGHCRIQKVEITFAGDEPSITLSSKLIDFGSVEQDATVPAKKVKATLDKLTEGATAYFKEGTAFSLDKYYLSATDSIAISVLSTATQGTYEDSLFIYGTNAADTAVVKLVVTAPFTGSTWSIDKDNFDAVSSGSGYAKYDGVHTLEGFSYTSSNVMINSSSLQFKGSTGYLYNSTTFGQIVKIEITKTGTNSLNVFPGTSANPTSGAITGFVDGNVTTYTFPTDENYGFFRIASTALSNVTPIKVYYYLPSYVVTVTEPATTDGALDVEYNSSSVAGQEVQQNKVLDVVVVPATGKTLDTIKVVKSGVTPEEDVTSEVYNKTTGKITMPGYAITVSAAFKDGVPTPVLNLTTGTYDGEQTAFISNFSYDYNYYYTTDGSDPTEEEGTREMYDFISGIEISSSSTIKVVTEDSDGNKSAIATYTYTINPVYTSIAAFITAAPTTTAMPLKFTAESNAVITGRNTRNMYVQDASGKGICIFNNSGVPAWTVGNKIIGTIKGTYTVYNGMPEMVLTDASGASAETAGSVEPIVVTEFTAETFAENKCKQIKIEDVYFQSTSLSNNQVTAKNASKTSFTIYNTFGLMSSKLLPANEDAADVTGVYVAYVKDNDTTYQVGATAIDAGDAQIDVDPVGGATSEEAVAVAMNSKVTVTPVEGFVTTLNGSVIAAATEVTIDEAKSITVASSRAFYTDKSVTYYYKIDESAKAVNIIPSSGGTVTATPSSASAGTTITLTYGEDDHFTFDHFIVMNGDDPVEVTETAGVYTFTMPSNDVTATAIFNEDSKFSVTYNLNGAPGTAPTSDSQYGDAEITLADAQVWTGYKFLGWRANNSGDTLAAGGKYTMQNAAVEFYAQWEAKPTFTNGSWIMVEDMANVAMNDYVIIAAKSANSALGTTQNSNNRSAQSVTIENNILTYTTAPAILQVKDGYIKEEVVQGIAFLDIEMNKYLFSPNGSNYLRSQDNVNADASWGVTLDASYNANILCKARTMYIRKNGSSALFSCYSTSQTAVQLYKFNQGIYSVSYEDGVAEEEIAVPAAQLTNNQGKATISSTVPVRNGYNFTGWKDADANDYESGVEYTFTKNTVLTAQWEAKTADIQISYDANGGTLKEGKSDPVGGMYAAGDVITLAEAVYEKTDNVFRGWSDGIAATPYQAGAQYTVTATATLTAVWQSTLETHWALVINPKQLKSGDKVIIVASEANYALGAQNGTYRNAVEVQKSDDDKKYYVTTLENEPNTLIVGITDNKITFHDGNGYLYPSSTTANNIGVQEELDDNGKWNVSILNGVATILSVGNTVKPKMQFNGSANPKRFTCYGNNQGALAIYKYYETLPEYVERIGMPTMLATNCIAKGGVEEYAFSGATFFEILDKDDAGKNVTLQEVTTLVAGMPYIIQPVEGANKVLMMVGGDEATAQSNNGLYGWLSDNDTFDYTIGGDEVYFVNGGKIKKCGTGCTIAKNRAYIVMDKIGQGTPAPGRRRITLGVEEANTPTMIDEILANGEMVKKVVIDNQMFIIRGGKMFNAQGAVVK